MRKPGGRVSKFTTSFLGRDQPGVVAAITGLFGEMKCNIEAMSQTRFMGEFSAIFIVETPPGLSEEELAKELASGLDREKVDLSVSVRPAVADLWGEDLACEPYVVTVDGQDGPGLIGAMSGVFARHGVNIENLGALLGHADSGQALFVFEIMVPENVDIGRLRRELALEAANLGLRASVQHRDIFEAMHRVGGII